MTLSRTVAGRYEGAGLDLYFTPNPARESDIDRARCALYTNPFLARAQEPRPLCRAVVLGSGASA